MNSSTPTPLLLAPLGGIEPHAPLMRIPSGDQLLYKVMTIENLLRSITNNYLYFNRVDSYSDFPNADENDGLQLPKDQPLNAAAKFQKAPDFSAADYYDQCRSRTYACCFSTENSPFIWENYANGSEKGKACVVFEFGKLRTMLNSALNPECAVLLYEGNPCHQIFSVNYGLVNYVPWGAHRTNKEHLSNPILYTYLKDSDRFSEEREFRISLSALGIGHFALKDGSVIEFPTSLQLGFDFRSAIASAAIQEVLLAPDADASFLKHELSALQIEPAPASEKK
jgi:hypothetical protein